MKLLVTDVVSGPRGSVDLILSVTGGAPLDGAELREWLRERDNERPLRRGAPKEKPQCSGKQLGLKV